MSDPDNAQFLYFLSVNMTADRINPVIWMQINKIIMDVFASMAVLVYPLAMFVIMVKSPVKMSYYKYFLGAQVTATTSLDVLFMLDNPTVVYPMLVGYVDGPPSRV
uniref:Serpentine receptor class gamma n=1 Tax=Panagrellus redivivus TaxID=6233 RepID=A0A7E4UR64_PANRE